MTSKQIGFLLCRLAAVASMLWALPWVVSALASILRGKGDRSLAEFITMQSPSLAMIAVAAVAWFIAPAASRWLVEDAEAEGQLRVGAAQFAAIGVALLGVWALLGCADGLVRVIAGLVSPAASDVNYIDAVFGGWGSNAIVQAVLGTALIVAAPSLGVWVSRPPTQPEEDYDEPA